MSDYGTPIENKIRDGLYETRAKDVRKNVLWEHFHAITFKSYGDQEAIELPYVECRKCNKVLTYDSQKGGTSHLRRHADSRMAGNSNCCCSGHHGAHICFSRLLFYNFH